MMPLQNEFFIECPACAKESIILALGGSDFIEHFELTPASIIERFTTDHRIEIFIIKITMKQPEVEKPVEPQLCIVCNAKEQDGKSNFCSPECHDTYTVADVCNTCRQNIFICNCAKMAIDYVPTKDEQIYALERVGICVSCGKANACCSCVKGL